MSERPAGAPRYIDAHLAEQASGERAVARPRSELFIHLGYWSTLTAGAAPADLRAAQQRLDDRVIGLAQVRDGLAILDVGCGFGGTVGSLDAAASGLALTGVNIDPRQLRVAAASVRPRPGNRVRWLEADACALPLADAAFDRVLAVECVFHFASRRRFMHEAARVLGAGGRLVLSDLVAAPELTAARARGLLPAGLEATLHEGLAPCPHLWEPEGSYPELAAAAGLAVEAIEDATLATLPTYSCILGGKLTDFAGAGPAAEAPAADDRAVAALAWLHLRGLLRVEIWAFCKASGGAAARAVITPDGGGGSLG